MFFFHTLNSLYYSNSIAGVLESRIETLLLTIGNWSRTRFFFYASLSRYLSAAALDVFVSSSVLFFRFYVVN